VANKHTIIVIASIAVIAGSVAYSSLNLVSAQELQFRWHQAGGFDFLSILVSGKLGVCNNSDYPATFRSYSFSMNYDGSDLGTFATDGAGVPSHSIVIVNGKLQSDDQRISQMFFSFLDTEFGGTDVTRVDADKMKITTTLDTTIVGIIPYTITKEYSGQEFLQLMNQKTSCDQ
jgi:hypothetical protein